MTRRACILLLACALWPLGCERAPRPDPTRWTKVKAEDVPAGTEKPVVLKTVKFDVGVPESAGEPPGSKRPELDPLPTKVEHGQCGDASFPSEDERVQVRATATKAGTLTVKLSSYRYYCSPKPSFAAGIDAEHGIVIAEVAPPPDTPIARCTCLHDVTVIVDEVPPGEHELRVFSRLGEDGDPVPAATMTVKVPG